MFQVDRAENRLKKLEAKRFAWMIEHIRRFEAGFRAPLQRLAPEMRAARVGAV